MTDTTSTTSRHECAAGVALHGIVEARIYATGAQLYVEHEDEVLCDLAVGQTVALSTLHPGYCVTKPLVPLAIAHLIDQVGLDLTAPLRSSSFDLRWLSPTASVADLLTHDAGMAEPTAALWRMTPIDRRSALFASSPARSGPAYSEVAAWLALAAFIEGSTGQSAERFVETTILKPAGLADDIIIGPERALKALECGRVQVPVAGLPVEQVPLLSEALPQQLADVSVAFGGLVNASGLGRLYTKIRRAVAGQRVEGMPSSCSLQELMRHRRANKWDATLRRACSFAGGFMDGLHEHGITDRLPGAIGHSSGIVPAFGLCDVERRLSIGCYLNGVAPSSADLQSIRTAVVAAVFADVGGSPT